MSDGLIQTCREFWNAAFADGATARPTFDITAATDNPTPAIIAGTNQRYAALTFGDGATMYARRILRLPEDLYLPGGLSARLLWNTPATSGNARWTIETAFAVPGDALDPAFNTADAVVTAANAGASRLITSEFASLDLTGAAVGALLFLRIGRTPGHASDTLGNTADLIGVELTYQRRMVLPQ